MQLVSRSLRSFPEQLVGLGIFSAICFASAFWVASPYYLILSLSAWSLWRCHSLHTLKLESIAFCSQFIFQAAWFLSTDPLLTLASLGLLWCNILATALLFFKKERISGILLLPLLLWIFILVCKELTT
jgi:tryptophan-rich sensory protein